MPTAILGAPSSGGSDIRNLFSLAKLKTASLAAGAYTVPAGKVFFWTWGRLDSASGVTVSATLGAIAAVIMATTGANGDKFWGCETPPAPIASVLAADQWEVVYPIDRGGDTTGDDVPTLPYQNAQTTYDGIYVPRGYIGQYPAGTVIARTSGTSPCYIQGYEVDEADVTAVVSGSPAAAASSLGAVAVTLNSADAAGGAPWGMAPGAGGTSYAIPAGKVLHVKRASNSGGTADNLSMTISAVDYQIANLAGDQDADLDLVFSGGQTITFKASNVQTKLVGVLYDAPASTSGAGAASTAAVEEWEKVYLTTTGGQLNYTVPDGVTKLYVTIWGPGGNGGTGGANNPGGGGGGGETLHKVPMVVTPGQVIPYSVGTPGQYTMFNLVYAKPGNAGGNASSNGSTVSSGGLGGGNTADMGDWRSVAGATGANGGGGLGNGTGGGNPGAPVGLPNASPGGAGGCPFAPNGGLGANGATAAGQPGQAAAANSGAGGSGGGSGGGATAGGAGGAGGIMIEFQATA